MRRLSVIAILLLALGIQPVMAQTIDLGEPIGWKSKVPLHTKAVTMPTFDLELAKYEDSVNNIHKIGPWRFGFEHQVDLGLNNSGTWDQLPNGDRIWRLLVQSPGALSLNFIFNKFELPEGAYVMLYPEDQSYYHKAYTAINNNAAQMLGTAILSGESIVIEYYEPASVVGLGELNLETVVHGYRKISVYAGKLEKALNSSGPCNIDADCPLGNGWEDQKKSVAMIVSGGGVCSGALVNNTAQNGTPYFLTANHCGFNAGWAFYFDWRSPIPDCATTANSSNGTYNELNGAQLRASNAGSDFALLELNATPVQVAGIGAYYAGWNKNDTDGSITQATGIHHPAGDIMKICRENNSPYHNTVSGAAVWYIDQWEQGVTEGGSSGSPLFDQNKRIIGQLYGGGAACNGTVNNGSYDYYGRFGVSWTGGGNDSTRLSNWLDPSGSGAITINGYNPSGSTLPYDGGIVGVTNPTGTLCTGGQITPVVTLHNYGTSVLTNITINYSVDGVSPTAFNWTGSLAAGSFEAVTMPEVTVSNGTHTYEVITSSPNGSVDSNPSNDTASSNFIAVVGGQEIELIIETDCWGTETTWEITDSSGANVLYNGGNYADNMNGTTETESFCLAEGCYKLKMYDSYGDGMHGDGTGNCTINGNYRVQDQLGGILTQMTAADAAFGSGDEHDFCVVKVGIVDLDALNVSIFPNPTNGNFNITFSQMLADAKIKVFDAFGRIVAEQLVFGNSVVFDLSSESSGVYIIYVEDKQGAIVRRLIKR